MPGFLAAVHRLLALIIAGEDNPYVHPNPELLEHLTSAGIRILRTDRDGAVYVLTDGKQLEISCFVACPEKTAGAASAQAQPPDQQQHREQ
jgi:competence protein ComEC